MNGSKAEYESYLSHASAAMHWDIPCLHTVFGFPNKDKMVENQTVEHRCYTHPSQRRAKKGRTVHICTASYPEGAVILHGSEWVASPELVFLDLARELDFHQCVLLGMQLCSSGPNQEKPLTTAAKLIAFLDDCQHHKGKKPALRAARYVADNSWSVMESLLYMLLVLPNKYGGYGLAGAELNHEVILREPADWQKSNRLTADLYWKEAKLVVEYDSFEHHNSVDAWVKDARRLTVLEHNGFNTLTINTAQVYNDASLRDVAKAIARHLGTRVRVRTEEFNENKARLRGLLPRSFALLEE